ncbi:hypothetical protein [Streptomyces sp. NPDC096132]|uniref:hypothetical protein n=1 Tax=Streptomyces sp. NPDC096132 TaxID=3366075 RepID=UPI0038308E16
MTSGRDPEWRTITVNAVRNVRGPTFDGGILGFLAEVLSGNHRAEVFPRGFPASVYVFSPYPPQGNRRCPSRV